MSTRQRLGSAFLYLVLVLVGTMFGASVYQRIAIIPEWGGNLPQSAITSFRGTRNGPAMNRFWAGVTGPTALAVMLAPALNWPEAARRRWIAWGAGLFFAMLAWTAIYFIPSGVSPPFEHGGEGLPPEAIASMARSWIFWDWFRMAGTLGAYLCFIKAAAVTK